MSGLFVCVVACALWRCWFVSVCALCVCVLFSYSCGVCDCLFFSFSFAISCIFQSCDLSILVELSVCF